MDVTSNITSVRSEVKKKKRERDKTKEKKNEVERPKKKKNGKRKRVEPSLKEGRDGMSQETK